MINSDAMVELAPIQTSTGVSVSAPTRLEDLLQAFITGQDVKQSSRGLYLRTLRLFFGWLERKGYDLANVARPVVIQYKEELLASGMSSLTVGSYLNSVKRFYEWAESQRFYPNVGKGVKSPKRYQQFRKQALHPTQAKALLTYCQTTSERDNALVNLLIRTGLRTIEAVRANVGDITFKGSQRVLMVQGKGRDERDNFVILTDKAYQPIARYLSTRGRVSPSDPLFISTSNNSKGERLTTRTVSQVAKDGLRAIGLDERSFTAHSLRHTTAVNILRAGGTLEAAQLTLRHSNPATTQIYTRSLDEERRLQNSGEALLDNIF